MTLLPLFLGLSLNLAAPADSLELSSAALEAREARYARKAPIRLLSLKTAEPDLRAAVLWQKPARALERIQTVEFKDPEARACGFILDLGTAAPDTPEDSMRFEFVDNRTLHAYRPDASGHVRRTRIHFSHPYATFHIRRERCLLRNGSRAPHCAIALTFKTENNRPVVVTSY